MLFEKCVFLQACLESDSIPNGLIFGNAFNFCWSIISISTFDCRFLDLDQSYSRLGSPKKGWKILTSALFDRKFARGSWIMLFCLRIRLRNKFSATWRPLGSLRVPKMKSMSQFSHSNKNQCHSSNFSSTMTFPHPTTICVDPMKF